LSLLPLRKRWQSKWLAGKQTVTISIDRFSIVSHTKRPSFQFRKLGHSLCWFETRGSPKSSKQSMLFGTTPSATRSEFAVNHNGRCAPNAVALGLASCLGLLQVVDHDFVRRAAKQLCIRSYDDGREAHRRCTHTHGQIDSPRYEKTCCGRDGNPFRPWNVFRNTRGVVGNDRNPLTQKCWCREGESNPQGPKPGGF
jgi:hypothetical protein